MGKKAKIWVRVFLRCLLKKIPVCLSYFFLVFSFITCMALLVPSLFDRVPTLSYYIKKLELPIAYELKGKVEIRNKKDEIITEDIKNLEIFVGGYSTYLTGTEFNLIFSSPKTEKIYVVIRYEIDGKMKESAKYVAIENGIYSFEEEFDIHE